MKTIAIALLTAMSAVTGAQASEFDGGFVGARIGNNRSDISGGALAAGGKDAMTFGIDGGYNWDMQRCLLGVDIFADFNNKKDHGIAAAPFTNNYGSDAYGLDLKLGLPKGSWMPYARLGYAHTKGTGGASAISGGNLHGGVGIEYKYTPNWGVNAEFLASSAENNGSRLNNDNFTAGVRYYFGAAKAAPVPAVAKEAPAPMAAKEAPAPMIAKEAPAPMIAKEAPAPMIAKEAPAPAPRPEPVAEPAPQPKESWRIIKEQTPVTIEGAHFDFDSAKLKPTAAAKLQPVVDFAKKYSDAGMNVHGHTDSIGTPAYNQKLSERRAQAVKAYLVKQGIDASRITTKGFGETEHIADNKTKEGRAKNRRVEIHYVVIVEKRIRVTE